MNEILKWDNYVKEDEMRNHTVIPYLTNKIKNNSEWESFMDLGSGSGYVSETIFNSVNQKKKLILLDINPAFLKFSKKNYFKNSKHEITFLECDYFDSNHKIEKVDCIYSVFSTLEFVVSNVFAKISYDHLKNEGSLILVVADSYFDILNYDKSQSKANEFIIHGKVELTKKAINSKLNRPYIATRITKIIELMLKEKMSLINFDQFSHPKKDKSKVFIMIFKKY